MELIKAYNGLRMEFYKGTYYVIDRTTMLVKAKGTKAECDAYFRQYAKEV